MRILLVVNVDGVMLPIFCISSDDALYLYQVSLIYLRVLELFSRHDICTRYCENILKGFRIIERA